MDSAPDIAGGHVLIGTSTTGEFERNVFGCTVECTGASQYRVITSKPLDVNRRRVWTQCLNAQIADKISVVDIDSTTFTIFTDHLIIDTGNIVPAPANYAFCFGVSEVPL